MYYVLLNKQVLGKHNCICLVLIQLLILFEIVTSRSPTLLIFFSLFNLA